MELSTPEIALRLVTATLLGGAVGLNRDLHRKPAGLRTHALVALGAAGLTATVAALDEGNGAMDVSAVSRAIQGIITGIGFLGAGVILHRDDGVGVHGLTTAATIWVVAAVGIICGIGYWKAAVVLSGLLLVILLIGGKIERFAERYFGRRSDGPPPGPP